MKRAATAAPLALLLAACWSTQLGNEGGLPPLDRPRTAGKPAEPPPRTTPAPTEVRGFADEDCHLTIIPGPVAISVRRSAPRTRPLEERAVVRVDLPVGHDRHPVGLSELTALLVSDAQAPTAEKPALRQAIAALGGDLQVGVGREWTRFTASVPAIRWTEALYEIADRLAALDVGHGAFDELQDRLLRSHLALWRADPLLGEVENWRRAGRPWQEVIEGIEDRTLPEVVLFHRRHYQPRGVAVGVWVPGAPQDASYLIERVKGALLGWQAGPQPEEVGAPTDAVAPPTGVRWHEVRGENESRVAALLPISPATPAWLTLLEAMTMDGVGGRLGSLLRARLGHEPVFHVSESGSFNDRYLVLETRVAAVQAPVLAEVLGQAWRSLASSPPTGDELRIARGRARLRLLRRQDNPDEWFEAAVLRLIRRQDSGPAADLGALEALGENDLRSIGTQWSEAPLAVLVSGGEIPADASPGIVRLDLVVPEYRRPSAGDVAASAGQAVQYLDLAVGALGDKRTFASIRGFSLQEEWRGADSVAATCRTTFRFPDEVERTVQVLGTEITAAVKGAAGHERAGADEQQLSAAEADEVCSELQRHPVALLIGYARGTAHFRLVGLRTRSARRVALVERVDDARPRLRFTIDVESGLVRSVETSVRRPGAGVVEVRDSYGDYRSAARLRVPRHRVTTVDGRIAVEAVVTGFELVR